MGQNPTRRDILGLGACVGVSLVSGQARGESSPLEEGDLVPPGREEGRKSAEERRESAVALRKSPTTPDAGSWIILELSTGLRPAFSMEAAGSPKFPGNLRDHSPCSLTPA
jgi:hypothetical protein